MDTKYVAYVCLSIGPWCMNCGKFVSGKFVALKNSSLILVYNVNYEYKKWVLIILPKLGGKRTHKGPPEGFLSPPKTHRLHGHISITFLKSQKIVKITSGKSPKSLGFSK